MMFTPASHFQIFLYPKAVDMRGGYDKLAFLCKHELQMNPYSGALFLFFNRDKCRARIFYYDGSGCCMFSKRLERGRFKIPQFPINNTPNMIMSTELGLLLEGVDVSHIKRPKPWLAKKELPPSKED